MKILKDIYKAVLDSYLLWVIGLLILTWGICYEGWLRIGIGILFIYWGIKTAINDYNIDRETEKWLKKNEGKILFFFASKKKIQEKIISEILPLFENNILKAFYEGPKISGDFEEINHSLKRIMFFNPKIRPHNPSIIKIEKGEFIIKDELKLLMEYEMENKINLKELKIRINKASA